MQTQGVFPVNNIYIDESGSINGFSSDKTWFVVCLLCVEDKEQLKRMLKRFIASNLDELKKLKKADKMFKDGKFVELKGSALTPKMKIDFLKYFSRGNLFKAVFIKVDNSRLEPRFCYNIARSFNYLIEKTIHTLLKRKMLPIGDYHICIDERNVRTESRYTLEDYLNTQLCLDLGYDVNFKIQYFDSCDNSLIQLADVFSNIFYSSVYNCHYDAPLKKLQREGYIPLIFEFPLK